MRLSLIDQMVFTAIKELMTFKHIPVGTLRAALGYACHQASVQLSEEELALALERLHEGLEKVFEVINASAFDKSKEKPKTERRITRRKG